MVVNNEYRDRKTVPYAPWAQVESFLGTIRILNPKAIDVGYLRANDMGGQQPGPLMNTIQFLGLVDVNGTPTAKLESLKVRGDEQYRSALAMVVQEAYVELFDAVNVESADRDLLYNQIRSVYGSSPRVAETATPLFMALCREAGLNVADELRTPASKPQRPTRTRRQIQSKEDRSPRTTGIARSEPVSDTAPLHAKGVGPALHIDVQVHIDSSATAEQIDQVFASMARHLYRMNGLE